MQSVFPKQGRLRLDWMFSPAVDICFFFLPVPVGVLFFLALQNAQALSLAALVVIIDQAFGLGPFHQGATWFHYFDSSTREHYLSSPVRFFKYIGVPFLLLAAMIAGNILAPAPTFLIYVLWSINHAVQQNIGILLLYHNSKNGEAVPSRNLEVWSQRLAAIFFSLLYFDRILLLHSLKEPWWQAIIAAAGIAAAVGALRYCLSLAGQLKQGKHLNAAALAFWAISVLYLAPFAFLGTGYNDALFIPLVVHWCQYIGINWVLTSRKYAPDEAQARIAWLKPMLAFYLCGALLVILAMSLGLTATFTEQDNLLKRILLGTSLGLGMMHYYMDGYLWRFRDAYPRESILPYIKRRSDSQPGA